MAIIQVVTGDPVNITLNLKKITDAGKSAFNIPTGAVVKAALVSGDGERKLTADATLAHDAVGADWSQSAVVVDIPKTETAGITEYGPAILRTQVNDGGEITWSHAVNIVKGHIA